MANEITQTVKMVLVNGQLKHTFDPGVKRITQTTANAHCPVVTVGTSEEDFSPGDVAAADQGIICLYNIDSTNFVKFGPKSGGSMVELGRLKPGEMTTLRLAPSVVMRWIADTAPVKVQVSLLQT